MDHNPVIALFLALGIIIAAARIAGNIARKFRQPRVLGELVTGILLGPTLLDLLHTPLFGLGEAHPEQTIVQLAELGVLLLMFKVGMEVNLAELLKVGRVAALAGVIGALLPTVMAVPIIMIFGYSWQPAVFAGVVLAATSVSISAQVLIELGLLRTREGTALLATALVDDVVAVLLVSLVIALTDSHQLAAENLLLIVGRMAGYIAIAFVAAWFGLPRFIHWVEKRPDARNSYAIPAAALVTVLFFGWSAEFLGGVAAITGAFIAGVGFSHAHASARHEIDIAVSNITYTFLVPIFFVSVGLRIDLSTFPISAWPLTAAILITAIVSKIAGGGAGARLGGFTNREALRVGVCMISRGEVGLIIAALGLSTGVLVADDPLFESLFMVIVLSTVLTPPLVRLVFQTGQTVIDNELRETPRQNDAVMQEVTDA